MRPAVWCTLLLGAVLLLIGTALLSTTCGALVPCEPLVVGSTTAAISHVPDDLRLPPAYSGAVTYDITGGGSCVMNYSRAPEWPAQREELVLRADGSCGFATSVYDLSANVAGAALLLFGGCAAGAGITQGLARGWA